MNFTFKVFEYILVPPSRSNCPTSELENFISEIIDWLLHAGVAKKRPYYYSNYSLTKAYFEK